MSPIGTNNAAPRMPEVRRGPLFGEIGSVPLFDVPGVAGLGGVVFVAAEFVGPHRAGIEAPEQGDDYGLVGDDVFCFVDEGD